ncbi:MAG TPA: hypothetical protein HA362_05305 [Nanoarchaeota archaeon]|nr:hypothetical protein [Nanoarchaeota archaeon]
MDKQALIELIRQKREFRDLDNAFVGKMLGTVLKARKAEDLKTKDAVKAAKETRALLREVYGAFLTPKFFQREKFLQGIKSLNDLEAHKSVLALHLSTKERLPFYETVYQKIFAITGKPSTILDLGCGLNPFSIPFMHIPNLTYYAAELAKADAEFIQEYFTKAGVRGSTFQMDLTEAGKFPAADVCFMFKVIDTLEAIQWDITAELLARLRAKWIVASFAKKSLGGRKTIKPEKRQWFERLIEKREYKTVEVENEIFYVIKGL